MTGPHAPPPTRAHGTRHTAPTRTSSPCPPRRTRSPNPRQAKGFLVTLSIPPAGPASRLHRCDVFALPEQPRRALTMDGVRPHPVLAGRLLIDLRGVTEPLTLSSSEPVHPLSMPRRVEMTCQLYGGKTAMPFDLVAYGEPKTRVCHLH